LQVGLADWSIKKGDEIMLARTQVSNIKSVLRLNNHKRYLLDFHSYVKQLRNSGDWRLEQFLITARGDRSVSGKEYLSNTDAFAYFAYSEIDKAVREGVTPRIFDIGSYKMFLSMLAVRNRVDALNLGDPLDPFTGVNYVVSDISDYDPTTNSHAGSYDFITSSVSFQLLGLGRYGDKMDCHAQEKFVRLSQVLLKQGGKILVSCSLGKDQLDFNNGWVFSLPSLKRVFHGFKLVAGVIDTNAYGPVDPARDTNNRFVKIDPNLDSVPIPYRGSDGSSIPYDIVFLTFEKS
jgi:hypothetical protein